MTWGELRKLRCSCCRDGVCEFMDISGNWCRKHWDERNERMKQEISQQGQFAARPCTISSVVAHKSKIMSSNG